jgi:drug/metabolite transporter (DMT)-like permease
MRYALAVLALAQFAVGAAAIFARFALTGSGPIAVSALRLLIASAPIAIVAAARGAYRGGDRRSNIRLALAGIALAAHFACWIASLRFASVAVSTLLVATTPIWTEACVVVRTRRMNRTVMLSVVGALVGVAVVVGFPGRAEAPLGIALALAGALAMAAYLLLVHGCAPRYDTLAIVGRTYPTAALFLLGTTLASGERAPPLRDLTAWGGIVAMALVSQLFGHTALNAAVRRLGATLVATVSLIEPVVAAVLAALLFGERLTAATFAGAAMVFAAIVIAVRAHPAARSTLD